MTTEAHIEKHVVYIAEKDGWFVRKLKWEGRVGAPDRLFIKDGRHVFMEFKAPGEEPGAIQRREHQRMGEHGAAVYVVDNTQHGVNILRGLE